MSIFRRQSSFEITFIEFYVQFGHLLKIFTRLVDIVLIQKL